MATALTIFLHGKECEKGAGLICAQHLEGVSRKSVLTPFRTGFLGKGLVGPFITVG
jgi:hypothetical protein